MKIVRSYWKDWPEGSNTLTQVPDTPMFDNEVVYVWGEENYNTIKSRGYTAHLVGKTPFCKDGWVYGRKLISLMLGLLEYGEVLMIDWDCVPVKSLDDEFYNFLQEKPTQVPIYSHPVHRYSYFYKDYYISPNFGFCYSREKEFGGDLVTLALKYGLHGCTEEHAMFIYADCPLKYYIRKYHPKVCYGVDKDFYLQDKGEENNARIQLDAINLVESCQEMNIYFKHT